MSLLFKLDHNAISFVLDCEVIYVSENGPMCNETKQGHGEASGIFIWAWRPCGMDTLSILLVLSAGTPES